MLNSISLRASLILVPIIGLNMAMVGCDRQGAAGGGPPGGGMMAVPVTAVSAAAADVPVYLDEIGKAVASESVTVVPQVSGIILTRKFEDGAEIKKGQLLYEIDPRPFQAQLDQAQGNKKKDAAQQSTAGWNVKQDQAAMQTKAISEQQLHTDMGMYDQAGGSIAVDDAMIETANLNLDYCQVKSPIDGRAGQRLVDAGNVVTAAGQAPGTNMLSIQKLDPIYADFTITEAELARVRQFMGAGTLAVQAWLPEEVPALPIPGAAPEHPHLGTLKFLDNAVQDGSGTIKLRAELPNADFHFWPGQFVRVRLVLEVKKGAVLIPNRATQISQAGLYVYTVQADSSAKMQPITLGQRLGDQVVVDTGLSAGDQVIVTGQLLLQPGAKVMVVPDGPPAGGPPGAAPASKPGDKPADGKTAMATGGHS